MSEDKGEKIPSSLAAIRAWRAVKRLRETATEAGREGLSEGDIEAEIFVVRKARLDPGATSLSEKSFRARVEKEEAASSLWERMLSARAEDGRQAEDIQRQIRKERDDWQE